MPRWNREFPDQPMHVARHENKWRVLDSWLIPTFYAFRCGKLVDRWNDWGPNGVEQPEGHLRGYGLPD